MARQYPATGIFSRIGMETFNFQINPKSNRMDWEQVPAITLLLTDRLIAVQLAKQTARNFKAEVRLTQGINPLMQSGSYFRYDEQ